MADFAEPKPYGSYGNGSAMPGVSMRRSRRILEQALELARQSSEITHNHPQGIKGAQAVASAVYLARAGAGKKAIRDLIETRFYPLKRTVDEIRPFYSFDTTCQGTVPQAITAFLESVSFEDALRTAVSLGGDSDTLAAITGAIAWPFYAQTGIDGEMRRLREIAMALLPRGAAAIVAKWEDRCGIC